MHQLRCMYGFAIVRSKTTHSLDVVCMVMRNEHCIYVFLQTDSVVLEMLLQGSGADACIEQDRCITRLKQVAVSAATRTQ